MPTVSKSGSLNLLEPTEPAQAYSRIVLSFPILFRSVSHVKMYYTAWAGENTNFHVIFSEHSVTSHHNFVCFPCLPSLSTCLTLSNLIDSTAITVPGNLYKLQGYLSRRRNMLQYQLIQTPLRTFCLSLKFLSHKNISLSTLTH